MNSRRGSLRRFRQSSVLAGMMLHIDGSEHRWLGDDRRHELIVILDDVTSEIYYTQLVEVEGTQLRVDCRRAFPPRKVPLRMLRRTSEPMRRPFAQVADWRSSDESSVNGIGSG